MSYYFFTYSLLFLPIVMILYQLCPKKLRWSVVLFINYLFFYLISNVLIVYLIGTTAIAYFTGRILDKAEEKSGLKGKELTRLKRIYLWIGIMINVVVLVMLKYLKVFGIGMNWLAPIGISYYTLQAISFMTDVYRGTVQFEKNPMKLALYLSYFPQIMEGPISRYSQIAEDLYGGRSIEYKNLCYGYQRIVWGLFKKMLIADRLAPIVSKVFNNYAVMDGSAVWIGSICFTIQLYMEFSGCMDIVIGTAEIFGVTLPENFTQPFFAKNASEFWRRWHITLGAWLKDYVFYPISLAKPVKKLAKKFKNNFGNNISKFVAPTVALFFVWLGNGVWHGPRSNYLFYGMYYFIIIFIENITEKPVINFCKNHKINRESKVYKGIQIAKLMFIVLVGEMFFRAASIMDGFAMLKRMFFNFNLFSLAETNFGVDIYDIILAVIFGAFVLFVDIIKENGVVIRDRISSMKLTFRWLIWYSLIIVVIIFGAYGKGYSIIDMIYAAY